MIQIKGLIDVSLVKQYHLKAKSNNEDKFWSEVKIVTKI